MQVDRIRCQREQLERNFLFKMPVPKKWEEKLEYMRVLEKKVAVWNKEFLHFLKRKC